MRHDRFMRRTSPCLGALVLAALLALPACSDHSIQDRPQIALSLGAEGIETSLVPIPYVATGDERTVSLLVQNLGREVLEVEVPELSPVDWAWAAKRPSDEGSLWPFETLTLGEADYGESDLLRLLERNPDRDPSVALGAAYVRAKLLVESGANRSPIEQTLRSAEEWFETHGDGGRVPFGTDSESAAGASARTLADELTTFATGTNRDFSFDPRRRFVAGDFPLTIDPGADRTFEFKYAPQSPRDGRPVQLHIRSNDGFGNADRSLLLKMTERTAVLRAVPSTGIFMNPSYGAPGFQSFRIENDGTDDLVVTAINLGDPSLEGYSLIPPDKPQSEWIVPPSSGTFSQPLEFSVRYGPIDDPVPNEVLINSNSAGQPVFTIPLRVEVQERAEYEITYQGQNEGYLNFIGEPQGTERRVSIRNLGPSNFILEDAFVQPTEAALTYEIVVQTPPATPDAQPRIHEGPVSIQAGRTVDVIVRLVGDPDSPVNGTLRIEYKNPNDFGATEIPVIGGEAAPQIVVGPRSVRMAFTAGVGGSDTNTLVIGNTGNAPLTIHGVDLFDQQRAGGDCDDLPSPSDHFSLEGDPPEDIEIPPFSIKEVTARFAPQIDHLELIGYLQIRYDDPLAVSENLRCQTAIVTLIGNTDTAVQRPVPQIDVLTTDPRAEQHLVLDGVRSDPGDGEFFPQGFSWYLGRKPAGSKTYFAEEGPSRVQLVPDVPGLYRIYMSLFSQGDAGVTLYSDLTHVDIEVGAAEIE